MVWALAMAVVVLASITLSEGMLIYTLDDPYIHLAVAENIVTGGYGINAEEFSSPSSSILYPVILALTVVLGLGALGPLLVNILAAGLSVWLLLDFFWRHAVPENVDNWPVFTNVMAPLLILSISALALPMTGMEHSLHVLAVIVVMRGLVVLIERDVVSGWLVVATICMPFLRFEGVALAVAAIIVLIATGHWRSGVMIFVSVLTGLGVCAVLFQRLGLPILPSSVLIKSNIAVALQDARVLGVWFGLVGNLLASFQHRWGIVFAIAICASLFTVQERKVRWRSRRSPSFLIVGVMALGLGAHLVAGRYGWFHRYEVYAVAILVTGGIYLLRPVLLLIHNNRIVVAQLVLLVALEILILPYVDATITTPRASRNIYEQQFQMHRFATEFFPRRVAVNDIGWVSYDNDLFVLDLWGLGSETVRKLRADGRLDAIAIADLAEKADIDFAMIYGPPFAGLIPDSWCLLAVLQSERVTVAFEEVRYFATKPSVVADMRIALDRFASALPERVLLKKTSCE